MTKDIPYYSFEDDDSPDKKEAYIDDGELKDMLFEFLGDRISEDEIEEILRAASDENLSEDDFDRLLDDFILKNKK